jgi:hypothetical protein
MADASFLGKTATDWAAVAAIAASVSAIASLINVAIVTAVAVFTFKYMRSTKELVRISKQQAEASIRQAEASIKTLEIMNVERRETESFQKAVFVHSIGSVSTALARYRNVLLMDAKPWHEPDCYLLPQEWETCRAYVSRKAPECLEEMLKIEIELSDSANAIQGSIRAPDSLWLSTIQQRRGTSGKLDMIQRRIEAFSVNVLQPAQSS